MNKRTQSRKPRRYIVKKGETLKSIAKKVYGDVSAWREIARVNDIKGPRILRAGQVLSIPRIK